MKLKFWFFAFGLISIIFLVEYDIARRTQARAVAGIRKPTGMNVPVAVTLDQTKTVLTTAPPSLDGTASFESRFKSESNEVARLQADPAVVEQRLEKMAVKLTAEDIKSLQMVMADPEQAGDDRALAIELLSRKRTPAALDALENFVLEHQTTTKSNWSRPQEFNSVLSAQAIEGIAAYPVKEIALTRLNALSKSGDESFLLDRIARSKQSLRGNVPSPDQIDDAALKKFVE